jgi:hypothetical protein
VSGVEGKGGGGGGEGREKGWGKVNVSRVICNAQ